MVGIFALNLLAESIYGILGLMNGEKIAVYPRLQKEDSDGKKIFNIWGLLSPLAVERQKTIYDTVRFTEKVIYPVAPKFQLVAPSDTRAETFVANKISKVISDTIDKIKIRLKYDYDGQSLATRNAANPKTVKLQDPKVDLWLLGTASPESTKDGFEKSIQPGNLEKENAILAEQRLKRTGALLKRNLTKLKIGSVRILRQNSKELQLKDSNEVAQVIANPGLLDTMRYVKADVRIPLQKLVITPITTPIAFPLWFLIFTGLALLLGSSRKKAELEEESIEPTKPLRDPKKFSWGWLWKILSVIVCLVCLAWLFVVLDYMSLEYLFWIIYACMLLFALAIIFTLLRLFWISSSTKNWKQCGMCIINFLRKILLYIFYALLFIVGFTILTIVVIILFIQYYSERLYAWWKGECNCCKILTLFLLLLLISFLIAHFGFNHIHW